MVPFAGYDMPVQYGGVIAECKAVREEAGMFDVSHMARLSFEGERVVEYLEWVTSNDVAKLEDDRGQYSLLPNEEGGCVDDIIVYRRSATFFQMVVNAANHEKDVAWLRAQNRFDVVMKDQTDETAMIAVQGPRALERVKAIASPPDALEAAPAFGLVECQVGGVDCLCARSGYTGEDGFELICAADRASALWKALLAAGVAPCGLGARDALRVEAGLPLYGHELGDAMSPLSAGLGWVIGKTKSFLGSDRIAAVREAGAPQKLVGVRLGSKRLLAPGMKVRVDGQEVGEVTSGVYSPLLECGIAFAFVSPDIALNTPCEVEIRGKGEPATIVGKRFFKRA